MIVLVLNCGSSSLKYQLLDMKSDEVYDLIAKGLVERIGMETGCLKHQATGKEKLVKEMPIEDHTVGIRAVMDALLDKEYGVLTTLEDIEAVGHRVVHGAEEFVCSQLITDKVIAQLEKCSVFAPLHNPANILGIKAVSAVLPTVPQVGVFDTAFHQTMPSYAYMYALPYEYYEKYGVRRYGFHGTSHRYIFHFEGCKGDHQLRDVCRQPCRSLFSYIRRTTGDCWRYGGCLRKRRKVPALCQGNHVGRQRVVVREV